VFAFGNSLPKLELASQEYSESTSNYENTIFINLIDGNLKHHQDMSTICIFEWRNQGGQRSHPLILQMTWCFILCEFHQKMGLNSRRSSKESHLERLHHITIGIKHLSLPIHSLVLCLESMYWLKMLEQWSLVTAERSVSVGWPLREEHFAERNPMFLDGFDEPIISSDLRWEMNQWFRKDV
jgi:hypothetical protein